MEKIIKCVGLIVSANLKLIEMLNRKPLLHKDESRNYMCMKLQGSGFYINLSSGIHITRNINGGTPVCTILKHLRLVHKCIIRCIKKNTKARLHIYLPDGNQ